VDLKFRKGDIRSVEKSEVQETALHQKSVLTKVCQDHQVSGSVTGRANAPGMRPLGVRLQLIPAVVAPGKKREAVEKEKLENRSKTRGDYNHNSSSLKGGGKTG